MVPDRSDSACHFSRKKTFGEGLRPDPKHPYVLAAADQDGVLYAQDVASPPQARFKIYLPGVVADGREPAGQEAARVGEFDGRD